MSYPTVSWSKRIRTLKSKTDLQRRLLLFLVPLLICLIGFLLLAGVESMLYISKEFKILGWLLVFVLGAIGVLKVTQRIHERSFKEFYRTLAEEIHVPELKYIIDLEQKGSALTEFDQLALKANKDSVEGVHIEPLISKVLRNRTLNTWWRITLSLLLVASVVTSALTWVKPDPLVRTLVFWQDFQRPNPFDFEIYPGDFTVEQGGAIQPRIQFLTNEVPEQVTFELKTHIERNYRQIGMAALDSVTFGIAPLTLVNDATYRISMDGFVSPEYRINVEILPQLEVFIAKITPPEYTKLALDSVVYPFSSLVIPEGGTLELSGRWNKPMESQIVVRTTSSDSVSVGENRSFYTSFSISADDSVSIQAQDKVGLTNRNPYRFVVTALKDAFPEVTILSPESYVEVNQIEELILQYDARDDYRVRSAVLRYKLKKAFSSETKVETKRLPLNRSNRIQEFVWDVSTLSLSPRDELEYWISVSDNDEINGSKWAESVHHIVKIPSVADYLLEQSTDEEEVAEQLQQVGDKTDQFSEQYEELLESLKNNPNDKQEQQRAVEQLKEDQKNIQEDVEKLKEQFEEFKSSMDEDKQLSEETLKAYEELQKVMEDIENDELKKALEQLQNQLEQFDQRSLKEALENVEFNENQYKERIERTIELFKSLKLNADLERIDQSLKELAEQETQLKNSTESPQTQQRKQQEIKEQLQKVMEKVDELSEQSPKKAQQKVQELEQQLSEQAESTQQKMDEDIKEMQQQQSPNSERRESIEQDLQSMRKQVQGFQQQMQQQQMRVNVQALEMIVSQLQLVSEEEEALYAQVNEFRFKSDAFIEAARTQQLLNGVFSKVADSLFVLSTEIPAFATKINDKKNEVERRFERSLTFLTEREPNNSGMESRLAMAGVNELLDMLTDLLEELENSQNGGGGSGSMSQQQMMEQLQQMGEGQQQLNEQLQQMINDIQGNRLTQDQMSRMEQMAKRQNQIRKQLQELKESGGLEQGDKTLSELERLAEEMEEAINDLRGGRTDRILIQRQQNILSRMLEAEKSLEQRGKEDKREGENPKEQKQRTSPTYTLEELRKEIERQQRQPEFSPYHPDYLKLIDAYLRLLEKEL